MTKDICPRACSHPQKTRWRVYHRHGEHVQGTGGIHPPWLPHFFVVRSLVMDSPGDRSREHGWITLINRASQNNVCPAKPGLHTICLRRDYITIAWRWVSWFTQDLSCTHWHKWTFVLISPNPARCNSADTTQGEKITRWRNRLPPAGFMLNIWISYRSWYTYHPMTWWPLWLYDSNKRYDCDKFTRQLRIHALREFIIGCSAWQAARDF